MFLRKHFPGDPVPVHEAGPLANDIVENLRAMLTARRGSSSFRPSYGLSTVGYLTAQQMVAELGAQIAENIASFEPRLEVLEVEEVHDEETNQAAVLVSCRARSENLKIYILSNPRRTEICVGARPAGLA